MQFGGLVRRQQQNHDIQAGVLAGPNLVVEPIPASRPRQDAQAPRPRSIDPINIRFQSVPGNSPRKVDALLATGASQWIKGPKKIVKPPKGATDSQQMTLFKGDSVSPQECDKFARDAIIQAGVRDRPPR